MSINRRQFVAAGAAGLSACFAFGAPRWRAVPRLKDGAATQNSARNLIFILLGGAPSHVDTFDLKPGAYTPDFIGVQDMGGGLMWPSGIFPNLAERLDRFSIVRAINAVEAVHDRAVYHLLTAHRLNAALAGEIPHFASVISWKLASQRRPQDSLPSLMFIGQNPAKEGFLGPEHMGIQLTGEGVIPNLAHQFDRGDERFTLLESMWAATPNTRGKRGDHLRYQEQARTMMKDEELSELLSGSGDPPDPRDFFTQNFIQQCETAVRLLEADKGVRALQLQLEGWDHHIGIYNQGDPVGLAGLSRELDEGFAYLLDTLAAKPGQGAGSMLDETLIVAMGEFGRTTGPLNTSGGRDHYPYVVPALFAGGGVMPGRVIGSTDARGDYIVDSGWSRNRYMSVNDVVATMYSALGIDWTERVTDTPSGRIFDLVDIAAVGEVHAIDELFV